MAPVLGEQWQGKLIAATENACWRADRNKPVSTAAILTLESFAVVPCNDGGIQLEFHRDGIDFELNIEPDGRIGNILMGPTSLPLPSHK